MHFTKKICSETVVIVTTNVFHYMVVKGKIVRFMITT